MKPLYAAPTLVRIEITFYDPAEEYLSAIKEMTPKMNQMNDAKKALKEYFVPMKNIGTFDRMLLRRRAFSTDTAFAMHDAMNMLAASGLQKMKDWEIEKATIPRNPLRKKGKK